MATGTPGATPFPWLPMLAIAIGLVSHSYSLSSLFPYVGYMVQQLGVAEDKDEAGQYKREVVDHAVHRMYASCVGLVGPPSVPFSLTSSAGTSGNGFHTLIGATADPLCHRCCWVADLTHTHTPPPTHAPRTRNKGYYAGYLSSAFMIGRFASSYFWGRCADRYGRLPVMYIGLCSIATFSVAFGLSTTFWWAVSCR